MGIAQIFGSQGEQNILTKSVKDFQPIFSQLRRNSGFSCGSHVVVALGHRDRSQAKGLKYFSSEISFGVSGVKLLFA